MKLTENDYYSISEQITEDNGSVEYSKNGETLFFDYTLSVDGYGGRLFQRHGRIYRNIKAIKRARC